MMKSPIIVIGGNNCAGKTTVATILKGLFQASRAKVELVRFSDPLYKAQEIFSEKNSKEFLHGLNILVRSCFGAEVLETAFQDAVEDAIARKRVVICDDMRFTRELSLAKALGAVSVWVEASEETRRKRGENLGIGLGNNLADEQEHLAEYDHVIWNEKEFWATPETPNLTTAQIYQLFYEINGVGSRRGTWLVKPKLDLSKYDAIEVHPVEHDLGSGTCEITDDPERASSWSVYLHLRAGGVECIADWQCKCGATEYARTIEKQTGYPVY
ncbi:hypothetical protein A2G06_16930 (plasmid) [Geobacter anodireducens]|nr:hypothetical protein A2G06_16930 [Geobacter anodireducens]